MKPRTKQQETVNNKMCSLQWHRNIAAVDTIKHVLFKTISRASNNTAHNSVRFSERRPRWKVATEYINSSI